MGTHGGLLYLEDAPVSLRHPSRGLSKANVAIVDACRPFTSQVLVFETHQRTARTQWHASATTGGALASLAQFVVKAGNRAPRALQNRIDTVAARLIARYILPGTEFLFAPVGGDWRSLIRAAKVSDISGLSFYPYLVDDPVESARMRGDGTALTLITGAVRTALSQAQHVFTITKELGQIVAEYTSRPTSELLLPTPDIDWNPDGCGLPEEQLIFVGAINPIYEEALVELASAMAEFNNLCTRNLKLRLTSQPRIACFERLRAHVEVHVEEICSYSDLLSEIYRSFAAALVVSSHETALGKSSFPSKSLDYLAAANNIVLYSRDDSAIVRYFRDHSLPHVATSQSEIIGSLLNISLGTSQRQVYLRAVQGYHSGRNFRNSIIARRASDATLPVC